eukprot:TRINITY_DN20708_c0_g1_i2.p1 TRINITY_DN20708_c0_g1~~TRINITY_DN20708_c0_g1_i2.p1  ORF type:complete len:196 (-),score=43.08 TRINITY_DN20708_c0_g1_i2:57-644(-)
MELSIMSAIKSLRRELRLLAEKASALEAAFEAAETPLPKAVLLERQRREAEKELLAEELQAALQVLQELRRHRTHTPFFKVVARCRDGSYMSVFDGLTRYRLGALCRPTKTAGQQGSQHGCFVHTSIEDAEKSVASFPRESAAWAAPRVLLAVTCESGFRWSHGKVLAEAVRPLQELPWRVCSKDRMGMHPGWRW